MKKLIFIFLPLMLFWQGIAFAEFVILNEEEFPGGPTELINKAEQGDANIQRFLGDLYLEGGVEGFIQSDSEAYKWYTKAAEQGNAEAQYKLGDMLYFSGEYDVDGDHQAAFEWIRKAAEQGHTDAQFALAGSYEYADGVGAKESTKWYKALAKKGEYIAQYILAERYYSGSAGVPQSYIYSYMWLDSAYGNDNYAGLASLSLNTPDVADKLSPAELRLAEQLSENCEKSNYKNCGPFREFGAEFQKGVEFYELGNYEEVFTTWKPLAEQGNHAAQNNLGDMYLRGKGVAEDIEKSLYWYRKSARGGNLAAQKHLGFIYKLGESIPKNHILAYVWLAVANNNNNELGLLSSLPSLHLDFYNSYEIDDIFALESDAELEEAETLIKQCINSNYQDCPE